LHICFQRERNGQPATRIWSSGRKKQTTTVRVLGFRV
jgi:hypothetical protein